MLIRSFEKTQCGRGLFPVQENKSGKVFYENRIGHFIVKEKDILEMKKI